MKLSYEFSTKEFPEIKEVGGKALSLITMTKMGFNVPRGMVLTVDFFSDWLNELKSLRGINDYWQDESKFKPLADTLKSHADSLLFTEKQKSLVLAYLSNYESEQLFAIRSSSPEEDLAGASFAGGYETILGSNRETIFDDIKKAFISCLDERVFFYKSQNEFDTSLIRIAVVIQTQIASDMSGVGFSLNPLNNCYDEVVINANSGLGESVVSGMVTPDEWIIDKIDKKILDYNKGSKKKAIVLDQNGGTRIISGDSDATVLSDDQVLELTDLIDHVEKSFGFPVDIEWAYSDNELYLLQSRPITTYVPIPEVMQTEPHEKRILYLDGSLVKQGITSPISILGGDCIEVMQNVMFGDLMGKDVTSNPKYGMATTMGGRMYMNISTTAKLQGLDRMVNSWKMVDETTANMLEELDTDAYVPEKLPEFMKGALWGAVKNNMTSMKATMKAMKKPQDYKDWYQPFEDEFDKYLKEYTFHGSVKEIAYETSMAYMALLKKMLPFTYAAEFSRKKLSKQLNKYFDDGSDRMQLLERSLPDNVTIDMGMAMYELSQYKEVRDNDYSTFKAMTWSDEFTAKWQAYLATYGCRTHNELDIAVKRAYEDIDQLFNQIKAMSTIDDAFSPVTVYNQSQKLRKETYDDLIAKMNDSAGKKLNKSYEALVLLGGKREALKYWWIRTLDVVRKAILDQGNNLVQQGKLTDINDIFWFHLEDLDQLESMEKEAVDEHIIKNKRYFDKLSQVHHFPKMIDSRGKILSAKKTEVKEGEVAGQPISPGVVKGRIKVLKTPDEKPLLPGEIMVTSATDPGWTPLFINASAILLEVGGLLQHGALVAREYGKPCIAGIEGVMSTFKDGQLVEVDATRGIVKLLEVGYEEKS
ncbi:PEP/pyruvate-binding domain-containing protein [Acidaminobacter sp. JC074]|uniref:PEP/pyruvate-binding domain-containing protein n=1 Tax=Acidaminobacter sp. JC074 TaxID=2530199 RepID=UPI001F104CDB|nr:PEP/pyruvate-binding domain-containing protein [Acidaminobacter sp. JC074]